MDLYNGFGMVFMVCYFCVVRGHPIWFVIISIVNLIITLFIRVGWSRRR